MVQEKESQVKERTPEEERQLQELMLRRLVAQECVRAMAAIKDDPKAREAEEKYRQQLTNIEKKIEAITGRPPDVVVGLKPGTLTGISWNIKESTNG